jgi:hypothetical protein
MDARRRRRYVAAARFVLEQGGWCVLEACVDVPRQQWDPRLLICERDPEAVADACLVEIERDPQRDARLAGRHRRTLRSEPDMGAELLHVADLPRRNRRKRTVMQVRDGMNPIVVTVGPEHTLREAARRMTARGVGAAVVLEGPDLVGILSMRDIVRCWTRDGASCPVMP